MGRGRPVCINRRTGRSWSLYRRQGCRSVPLPRHTDVPIPELRKSSYQAGCLWFLCHCISYAFQTPEMTGRSLWCPSPSPLVSVLSLFPMPPPIPRIEPLVCSLRHCRFCTCHRANATYQIVAPGGTFPDNSHNGQQGRGEILHSDSFVSFLGRDYALSGEGEVLCASVLTECQLTAESPFPANARGHRNGVSRTNAYTRGGVGPNYSPLIILLRSSLTGETLCEMLLVRTTSDPPAD